MNQEARRKQTISCRMNVARVMKTWTTQSGYPLVSVNVNRQNGVVTLSQVRECVCMHIWILYNYCII